VPIFDNSMRDDLTGQGSGAVEASPAYLALLENYNLAQNSWNYEFHNNLGTSLAEFNPNDEGIYDICLEVREAVKGNKVAEVCIQVITTTPAP
jgi:hypothetical protein